MYICISHCIITHVQKRSDIDMSVVVPHRTGGNETGNRSRKNETATATAMAGGTGIKREIYTNKYTYIAVVVVVVLLTQTHTSLLRSFYFSLAYNAHDIKFTHTQDYR